MRQLTSEVRPAKKPGKAAGILSSKIFMVCAIGLIALIIIIIIGAILGTNKGDKKTLAFELALHLNNTEEVIQNHQPNIKSSTLKSASASLSSVLSDTYSKLEGYLVEKYNFDLKKAGEKITEEATLHKDGLEADLFEAKINGILDKVYANKMVYEISLFMAEEAKLSNKASDEVLQEILTTSYNSLGQLYDEFNNFSGTS